jgi:ABC-type uncharacterized transport system permease subunit
MALVFAQHLMGFAMRRKAEGPDFTTVLRIVTAIAALSASLAVALAIYNVYVQSAQMVELIRTFVEIFKACVFTILGLLGGRVSRRTP